MLINELTEKIIECAITVHKKLGPGLLESVYQAALAYELKKRGIKFEREKGMPAEYEDIKIDIGFRCDFYIENTVIVECKSVKEIHPIDNAQLLTYLRLSKLTVGLLINFNVILLKDGIKRIVNNYKEE